MEEEKSLRRFRLLKGLGQTPWMVFCTGLITTLFFAWLYTYMPPYLRLLELKLYDSFLAQSYTPPKVFCRGRCGY